jgi:hypothetical protein
VAAICAGFHQRNWSMMASDDVDVTEVDVIVAILASARYGSP